MNKVVLSSLLALIFMSAEAQAEERQCDSSCVFNTAHGLPLASNIALIPPPTDQCRNLAGIQPVVPQGYGQDKGGFCLLVPNECPLTNWKITSASDVNGVFVPWCDNTYWAPAPWDMCDNIPGVQDDVPAGYEESNGICTLAIPTAPPGKSRPSGPWPLNKAFIIDFPVWKTGYSNSTSLVKLLNVTNTQVTLQNINTGATCVLEFVDDLCSWDSMGGLYYNDTAINLVNNAFAGNFFMRESGGRGIEKITVTVRLTANGSLETFSYYSGMGLDFNQSGSYAYVRADKMIIDSSRYSSFPDNSAFNIMPTPLEYTTY